MSLFSGLKERLRDGLKRSQEYLATGLATVLEDDRPIDERVRLDRDPARMLLVVLLDGVISADAWVRRSALR